MKKVIFTSFFVSLILALAPIYAVFATQDFTTVQRSGCCSHHGGVCGCSAGRALCCDGSLSPSCGCY